MVQYLREGCKNIMMVYKKSLPIAMFKVFKILKYKSSEKTYSKG